MLRLKQVKRAGWMRYLGPDEVESVADHSFGLSLLATLFCPPKLNKLKVLEMVVLHDLAEVKTGDLTPYDGVPSAEKAERERRALDHLLEGFADRPRFLELAGEYQDGLSPEARFVKDLDKLEMALQSLLYQRDHPIDLSEFRASAQEALNRLGLSWVAEPERPGE